MHFFLFLFSIVFTSDSQTRNSRKRKLVESGVRKRSKSLDHTTKAENDIKNSYFLRNIKPFEEIHLNPYILGNKLTVRELKKETPQYNTKENNPKRKRL